MRTLAFFCSNSGSVVCRVAHEHAFSGVDGDGRDGQCRFVGNVHFPHAVVVNAKPLYPFAVDLLGIVDLDFLHQFVEHPRRELSGAGVFADDGHEHIR